MNRKTSIAVLAVLLMMGLGSAVYAQGNVQQGRAMQRMANPATLVTLSGVVTEVNIAYGQGFPSFKFLADGKEVTVVAGPYWALAAADLQIIPGANLTVKAYPSLRGENTYVAVEIADASGAVVSLHRPRGRNFGWRGRAGMGGGGLCLAGGAAAESMTLLEGTVTGVQIAAGQGFPHFVFATAGGDVTVVTSPFWALQQTGFQISAGDRLAVKAFASLQREKTYVAVEIQNLVTGDTVRLRGDDGQPSGMRGRGRFVR